MKCYNCEDLREQIKDLENALAAYEAEYWPRWTLPDFPDLKLTPQQRYVLQTLHKRLGQYVNMASVFDSRPRPLVEVTRNRQPWNVILNRLRKAIAGTPYKVENAYGGGYRLILQQGLGPERWEAPLSSSVGAAKRPEACSSDVP